MTTMALPVLRSVLPVLLSATIVVASGPAPAVASPAPVRGTLLPVPAAGPGEQLTVTAVDAAPLGVVGGTASVRVTNPDGTVSTVSTPQRWVRVPRVGWVRQPLALPDGATSGVVAGLADTTEAAGLVTLDGVSRAVRWSVTGFSSTLIGDAASAVTAVGPNGPWGVVTDTAPLPAAGYAELVTRDGTRTLLAGTPELDAGYRRGVGSIGGPTTALVWVTDGVGMGTTARPVLRVGGATLRLPVVSSYFLRSACVSPVLADGSVVFSGYSIDGGQVALVMVRHVGGVPGTDVELSRATAAGEPVAGLACNSGSKPDNLAADGGIAGFVTDSGGTRAAYWNADNERTLVPLEAGERSAKGVAVANGGRMVIQAEGEDGSVRLSLWHNGVRRPLTTPDGWTISSVIELTDHRLLVTNVRDASGAVRPAVWEL
jgi:hypothetical protein